jgi:hypothetical protein
MSRMSTRPGQPHKVDEFFSGTDRFVSSRADAGERNAERVLGVQNAGGTGVRETLSDLLSGTLEAPAEGVRGFIGSKELRDSLAEVMRERGAQVGVGLASAALAGGLARLLYPVPPLKAVRPNEKDLDDYYARRRRRESTLLGISTVGGLAGALAYSMSKKGAMALPAHPGRLAARLGFAGLGGWTGWSASDGYNPYGRAGMVGLGVASGWHAGGRVRPTVPSLAVRIGQTQLPRAADMARRNAGTWRDALYNTERYRRSGGMEADTGAGLSFLHQPERAADEVRQAATGSVVDKAKEVLRSPESREFARQFGVQAAGPVLTSLAGALALSAAARLAWRPEKVQAGGFQSDEEANQHRRKARIRSDVLAALAAIGAGAGALAYRGSERVRGAVDPVVAKIPGFGPNTG